MKRFRSDAQGRVFLSYKHTPGGRWCSAVPDPTQQVFSHRSADDGQWRHYDVARLWRMVHATPKVYARIAVALLADQVEYVRSRHGIEQAHLDRMTSERLEQPGLVVLMADASSILVDGNHRYVRRSQLGHRHMRFVELTEVQAMPSLLDIPDDVAARAVSLPVLAQLP